MYSKAQPALRRAGARVCAHEHPQLPIGQGITEPIELCSPRPVLPQGRPSSALDEERLKSNRREGCALSTDPARAADEGLVRLSASDEHLESVFRNFGSPRRPAGRPLRAQPNSY